MLSGLACLTPSLSHQHAVVPPHHVGSVLTVAMRTGSGEAESLGNLLISLDLKEAAFVSNPRISMRFPELTGLSLHEAESVQVCSDSSEDAYRHLHPWGRPMLGFHMSTKRTPLISNVLLIPLSLSPPATRVTFSCLHWLLDPSPLQGITSQDRCHLTHYHFTLRGRAL